MPDLLHWALYRYQIPFRKPLRLLGSEYAGRSGLLLRLEASSGASGWGEIAPLPGLHQEPLSACEALVPQLFSSAVPPLPPSVEFGLSTALQMLEAQSQQQPPAFGLPEARQVLPLNGLLTDSGASGLDEKRQLQDACTMLQEEGFTAVKLKVGWRSGREDAKRVHWVREALGSDVELRADANRGWTWEEALTFAEHVSDAGLAYCEEPLQEASQLSAFGAATQLPLALDETLWPSLGEPFPEPLPQGVVALVIKPAVLGSWASLKRLMASATASGTRVIFSSAFESGIGLYHQVRWAAQLLPEPVACGLDTYRHLSVEVVRPAFTVSQAQVRLPDTWPEVPLPHPEVLTPIGQGTGRLAPETYRRLQTG